MKLFICRAALVAAVLCAVTCVDASPISTYEEADVQFTSGGGGVESVFVIDWNDGKTQESIRFGLRSDPGLTVLQALLLIDSLSPSLDLNITRYSFGDFIDGMAWDAERVTELAPTFDTPYTAGPPSVNGSLFHDFSTGYDGASDHFRTAYFTDNFYYFSFWIGTQGGSWPTEGSMMGAGDVEVSDGAAYGFAFNTGSEAPDAIPEPELLLLLGIGFGVITWLRRAR